MHRRVLGCDPAWEEEPGDSFVEEVTVLKAEWRLLREKEGRLPGIECWLASQDRKKKNLV